MSLVCVSLYTQSLGKCLTQYASLVLLATLELCTIDSLELFGAPKTYLYATELRWCVERDE